RVGSRRRLCLDEGQLFLNLVREGLPTIRPGSSHPRATCCTDYNYAHGWLLLLARNSALRRIEDEVQNKAENRIHKQDWKPRHELEYEVGASNVIYMLYDNKSKLFYLGEAENLVKR